MVATVDGAATIDGLSAGIGGPADRVVFSAIRAVADVILVAAGTVRAEGYGPPRPSGSRRAERLARGQAEVPRLAVVSGSLDLAPDARWIAEATRPPLVYTTSSAPPERRAELAAVTEVVDAGIETVDPVAVLADLHRRGAGIVLAEGGPFWNVQLVAAGLVDELDLTIGPLLVGGDAARIAEGRLPQSPQPMVLVHLWEQDGVLFARYVRG